MRKKNYFLTGLLTLIPIYITFVIFEFLFNKIATPGANLIDFLMRFTTKILSYFSIDAAVEYLQYLSTFTIILSYINNFVGFILTFLFIYFLGMIVSNVLGKRLYSILEKIILRIPVVSYVYKTIKQIIDTVSISQKDAFQKVIYIEYPKNDVWTLALVTGSSKDKNGNDYYHVFVPTTPNPTSGFMLYINKKNVKETDLSIDEGLKIIISGGMLAPDENEL